MKFIMRTMAVVVASVCFAAAANAATFTVNTTADTLDASPGDGVCADSGGACSFRAALSEANALAGDDIITLSAVTYTQTLVAANDDVNAGGDWDITGNVTINGASAATTILQANAAAGAATERVINVRAGAAVTISNVTIRHGRFTGTMGAANRGGGIENLGSLTLNNVIVRDNQMNATTGNPIGAGIHNAGPSLTLNDSQVISNSNVRVAGGSAFGGGISSIVATAMTFNNSSVSNNSATSLAGGFGFGAGLYLENLFTFNATNSHFDNNVGSGPSGSNGNGVRALSNIGAAVFNATNCTFSGNSGGGAAPALHQGTGLQFFTTVPAASLTVTIDESTINGNSGNSLGIGMNFGISGGPMTATITDSTISNNTGGSNGGGVFIASAATGAGAGIYNFINSTVSGNTATGSGGGIVVDRVAAPAMTVNLNFTTVAGNTANSDNAGTDSGGGIFRNGAPTINLQNSIIADNSVGTGGSAPDLSGTFESLDFNHIENLTGATINGATGNNTTGDPLLGPLANNGGPTQTHLPGAGSPVIDSIPGGTGGCGSIINADQRGTSRPQGAGCDKGSVEVGSAVSTFSLGGRVATAGGNGIRNASVTISGGGLPNPIFAVTGSFGYFNVPNLPGGATYTVTVGAKRFTFTPNSTQVTLNGNVINADFVANP